MISILPVTRFSACVRDGNNKRFVVPHLINNYVWESLDWGAPENARRRLTLIHRITLRISTDRRHGFRHAIVEVLAESFVAILVEEHCREKLGLCFVKYPRPHEEFLSRSLVCNRVATSSQSEAPVLPAS
jgi:hypothetical protein